MDVETGKKVWHFQAIHHGLWDLDFPTAPNLLDITVDGKPIKALAQVSKQGFIYAFDRVTGGLVVFQQPQDLDELATTVAIAVRFQTPAEYREGFRQIPRLKRLAKFERIGLPLQEGQVMHRIVVNVFRPPVAYVFGNETVVGNNPQTVERPNCEDLAIRILRRHAIVVSIESNQ